MGCAIPNKQIIPVIPKNQLKSIQEADKAKLNEDEAPTEILTKNKEKNDLDINEKQENSEKQENNEKNNEKNGENHEKEEKKTTTNIIRKSKKEESPAMTTIIRGGKPEKNEVKRKVTKALDMEQKT